MWKPKEFISPAKCQETLSMLPRSHEDNQILQIQAKLRDLESVTKALQREFLTLWNVSALFDDIFVEYSTMNNCLHSKLSIVQNPQLESAFVKIQEFEEAELSP